MAWVPMRYRLPACGAAKLSTTVFGPVALALVGAGVPVWASAGFLASRLKVNATSAALNGLPSLHFTPDLVVTVSVLPPLEKVYAVASIGTGAWLGLRMLKKNSGS